MMIENNPIDLATKMSRYEKRLTAMRLLKGTGAYVRTWQEICWAITLIITIVVGLVLAEKGVISRGTLTIVSTLASITHFYLLQLRATRRRIQALTDLVILREEEIDEAESERVLQKLNEGKSPVKKAAP